MMIRRNTRIALGALGALVIVVVLLARTTSDQPELPPTQSPEPIWSVESSDIVSLTIEDLRNDQVLELVRDDEDLWRTAGPEGQPVDASRVERAASWLSSPTPRAELFDALDLAAFELDEPHYRLTIQTRSGEQLALDIGRESPTGGTRYAVTSLRLGVLQMSTLGLDEVLNLRSDLLATATPEASATSTLEALATTTPEASATPTPEFTLTPTIELEEGEDS